MPGQQFGAIYPILVRPSTYLINNQGIPTDVVPGVVEKEEFVKRLNDAIEKTLSTVVPPVAPVVEPVSVPTAVAEVESSPGPSSVDESDLSPNEVDQLTALRAKVSRDGFLAMVWTGVDRVCFPTRIQYHFVEISPFSASDG